MISFPICNMIIPECLKQGDKIGIVATARKITPEEILPAVNKFKEWGLEVVCGKNLFNTYNQFAGIDTDRANDFQEMLDNPEIKAVICARGGYGTVRIIDKMNFSNFIKNPKWIIGYSDATVLHSHIHQNFQVATLHATMPINFPKDGSDNLSTSTLKKILFEKHIDQINMHPHSLNRPGTANGILIGGNLSILYSLNNSSSDIDTNGKILFIEDLDEYLYHIDRMMMALKRSGKLDNLAGLIVGGMTEMKDNTVPFCKTAEEIIAETVADYKYPVCFNFPAGHTDDNRAIILGGKYELTIDHHVNLISIK